MAFFSSYLRPFLPDIPQFFYVVTMLNRFKNALFNVVSGIEAPLPEIQDSVNKGNNRDDKTLPSKFRYARPEFLQLTHEEEIQVSSDHHIRPIIVPRDISKLPWNSGYAEAVNAGKSRRNEDQACLRREVLQRVEPRDNFPLRGGDRLPSPQEQGNPAMCLPYTYFAVFDGHAGVGAALAASNQLHHIIHEKLVDIIDHLLPPLDGYFNKSVMKTKKNVTMWYAEKKTTKESLIIGALESAFWDMDQLIGEDKLKYKLKGGCTALVALFILGKVYVSNSGDSRAVAVQDNEVTLTTNDHTPETEKQRIRAFAALHPELMGTDFTHLEFLRRPAQKDLGKRILYRDALMTGWAYKTVTQNDLRIPVVHGEGKRSRALATIGVTRGFGDHDLKAINSNVRIKPFMLCQPEVHVLDLAAAAAALTPYDVLLLGTDGLWDVTANDKAARIVRKSLDNFPDEDEGSLKYRYTSAAQDLVMHARGKLTDRNWRTEGRSATIDDITVFVLPLAPYAAEHAAWQQEYDGVCGMYDNGTDSSEDFGELSLKASPKVSAETVMDRAATFAAGEEDGWDDIVPGAAVTGAGVLGTGVTGTGVPEEEVRVYGDSAPAPAPAPLPTPASGPALVNGVQDCDVAEATAVEPSAESQRMSTGTED